VASRVSVVRIRIIGFADEAKQRYCLVYRWLRRGFGYADAQPKPTIPVYVKR